MSEVYVRVAACAAAASGFASAAVRVAGGPCVAVELVGGEAVSSCAGAVQEGVWQM